MRIDRALRGTIPYLSDMPMNHSRSFLPAFLIHGLLAILCLPSSGGYGPMAQTLQPYQVVSPKGTWRLEVKPGNREGAGPAATTLTNVKTGEIAWKRMLPYTFWQCCVNEYGVVGGFAYTRGPLGENDSRKDAGDFVVSFLDAQGVVMHEERSHRQPSSFGMGWYIPSHCAYRLLLDPGNDRMILLMQNGLFRCYDMRDGTLDSAFIPDGKGDASGYIWPDEIRFIPDTLLMLLQSNSAMGNGTETTCTSCIQLIDDGGRTLWAISMRKTYGADNEWPFPEFRIINTGHGEEANPSAGGVPFAEPDPFADVVEVPEPNGPPAPTKVADFEAYFGDLGEKAAFHILDSGGSNGPPAYRIVEISREKWTLPEQPSAEEEATPPADFPKAETRKLAEFQLKRADGTPLTNIVAITLGPEETIHALDHDKGLIHVFDKDGKYLHVGNPGKEFALETSYHSASIAADDKGEVFAKISGDLGVPADEKNPLAGHYLRFSADGNLRKETVAAPEHGYSGTILAQPNTDNLIFYGYGDEVVVNRRDEYSSRAATLSHRADGHWLDYIQDVACAPNGVIAVRDSSKGDTFGGFTTPFPRLHNHLPAETVTIYEADGEPIRTLDFSRFVGLTKIAIDGKHIVATFPYDPPTPLVYVFDSGCKPIGAIRIAELAGRERVNLRPFILSGGNGILTVDQESGMSFRLAMPTP